MYTYQRRYIIDQALIFFKFDWKYAPHAAVNCKDDIASCQLDLSMYFGYS